jgi:hypothetical protein
MPVGLDAGICTWCADIRSDFAYTFQLSFLITISCVYFSSCSETSGKSAFGKASAPFAVADVGKSWLLEEVDLAR